MKNNEPESPSVGKETPQKCPRCKSPKKEKRWTTLGDQPYPEWNGADEFWEVYHDDDCDGVITPYPDNLCLKCGMHPDFQSRGARQTKGNPCTHFWHDAAPVDSAQKEPQNMQSNGHGVTSNGTVYDDRTLIRLLQANVAKANACYELTRKIAYDAGLDTSLDQEEVQRLTQIKMGAYNPVSDSAAVRGEKGQDALIKYGRHFDNCYFGKCPAKGDPPYKCACGFNAALASQTPAPAHYQVMKDFAYEFSEYATHIRGSADVKDCAAYSGGDCTCGFAATYKRWMAFDAEIPAPVKEPWVECSFCRKPISAAIYGNHEEFCSTHTENWQTPAPVGTTCSGCADGMPVRERFGKLWHIYEADVATGRPCTAAPVGQVENEPLKSEIIGAVARGWCHEKNSAKIFDSDLANAIVEEVCKLRASTLHTASTKEVELGPNLTDVLKELELRGLSLGRAVAPAGSGEGAKDEEDNPDENECQRCYASMSIRDGDERTPFCDHCAHEIVRLVRTSLTSSPGEQQ